MFTQHLTFGASDAPRASTIARALRATTVQNRRTRLRAALLTAVWMLPGVWCAAHAIAHEIESGHHDVHLAVSASPATPAMSCDHEHEHAHLEAPLVLSAEGVKKLDAPVLLTAAADTEYSKASLRTHEGTVLRHAARGAAAASGPRAPPNS